MHLAERHYDQAMDASADAYLPVQLAHTPAGTSAKNLAHFMQGIRDGHFRRFDYGDEAEI